MPCEVLFSDGPMGGRIRVFDRDEPPPRFYAEQIGELVRNKLGMTTVKRVTYVREVNPFDEGPRWIYLLKEEE